MPVGLEATAARPARLVMAMPQTHRAVRWLSARRVVGFSLALAYAPAPAHPQKNESSVATAEMALVEPGVAVSGIVMVLPSSCTAKSRKSVPSASDHAKYGVVPSSDRLHVPAKSKPGHDAALRLAACGIAVTPAVPASFAPGTSIHAQFSSDASPSR